MAVFIRKSDPLVSCPYNPAHRMLKSRLQMHLVKCKKDNVLIEKKTCPFNAQHVVDPGRYQSHLVMCPDRSLVDRQITAVTHNENEFRGAINVPKYRSLDTTHAEVWELNEKPIAGYEPEKHLANKPLLIKDMAGHKPADKRKYYQDVFQDNKDAQPEVETSIKLRESAEPMRTVMRNDLDRRPKEDAKILQEHQKVKSVAKPAVSKIAAKFPTRPSAANKNLSEAVNEISSNFNRMSMGRGRPVPE